MKRIILGLSGSGKTTTYRQLNELRTESAVEIELPPSCVYDEKIKETLFKTFYKSKNIDTIILHYKFLPKNFIKIISKKDEIYCLNVGDNTRKKRLIKMDRLCRANVWRRHSNRAERFIDGRRNSFNGARSRTSD